MSAPRQPRLHTFPWDHFTGLDLRPGRFGSDELALISDTNIDVAPGGYLRVRPALIQALTLSSQSVGLYATGGSLRTVVPGGQGLVSPSPGVIQYDAIFPAAGTAYPTGKLASLIASTAYDGNSFVTVQRSDTGTNECHYIANPEPPSSPTNAVATKVLLPFAPGSGLMTAQDRVWATAPADGTVNFCHLTNGPTDWITPDTPDPTNDGGTEGDGAGFIEVGNNAQGARVLVALSPYRGINTANGIVPTIAVYFSDSIQLWTVDTNANNIAIRQTLGGPGTSYPGSIANVQGDSIFFGRGQFQSLYTETIVAEARDQDIAATIYNLTQNITSPTPPMRALWSSFRSQYLCAIGNTIYVYLNTVIGKLQAWTTWTLPVSVDYMVELNNVLWIRSGNNLYYLDVNQVLDYGTTPIQFGGTTRNNPLGESMLDSRKAMRWLTVLQNAPCAWQINADGRMMNARTYPGSSAPTKIMSSGTGRQIGLTFAGQTAAGVAPWQLQGVSLKFEVLAQ